MGRQQKCRPPEGCQTLFHSGVGLGLIGPSGAPQGPVSRLRCLWGTHPLNRTTGGGEGGIPGLPSHWTLGIHDLASRPWQHREAPGTWGHFLNADGQASAPREFNLTGGLSSGEKLGQVLPMILLFSQEPEPRLMGSPLADGVTQTGG